MAAFDIASVILVLTSALSTQGQTCPKNFLEFSSCLSQRLDAPSSSRNSQQILVQNETQARIKKCFTDNGCDGPDFDHDPCSDLPQPIRSFVDSVREDVGNAAVEVEQCLKAKFTRSTSECVAALGLGRLFSNGSPDQIRSASQIFEDGNGFFFFGGNSSNLNIDAKKRSIQAQANVARALRHCREKKGNDNALNPVLQCVMTAATSDAQRALCQAANSCDGDGASRDCKRQHRLFLHILCTCRREKQNEVLKKLDDLRKNESVPVLEVVKALGNGKPPEDTCDDIRSCFIRNGQRPPPALNILDLYISMQQHKLPTDKAGSAQMNVDRQTLGVIRDLFNAGDYGEDECKACDA